MNFAKTKLKPLGEYLRYRPMFQILRTFKEACVMCCEISSKTVFSIVLKLVKSFQITNWMKFALPWWRMLYLWSEKTFWRVENDLRPVAVDASQNDASWQGSAQSRKKSLL